MKKPVGAERNARRERFAMKKEFVLKIKPKKSKNAKTVRKSMKKPVDAEKYALLAQ